MDLPFNGSLVIYSTVFPSVFPSLRPYMTLALGVVELLLVSVFQHFLHHSTAAPHVKHSLSMLVSHLLHNTNTHTSILFSILTAKSLYNICQKALWEFLDIWQLNLQQSHQTCQTPVFCICRSEVWCTRSSRCSSQTPAAWHSTRRPVESESLPCLTPEATTVEMNICITEKHLQKIPHCYSQDSFTFKRYPRTVCCLYF